jgi:serine/threonine protein kinase
MPAESPRPETGPIEQSMDWEAFYNNFRKSDFVPGYEIQNRLGGGAFGDVYKARKMSIGKAYAIKFLKIDDDGQRAAVQRELNQVRHFAAIDHPNLVTIEDMGTAMGVPYLIMGYAGEDTLARRLREGTLGEDEAVDLFAQACRGVVALHDRRLVHFDLKPSNIFLKGNVARIGDYGLSKLMVDGRSTLSFGRGTPQYMAPEMIRSRADHRADLYSLGVILFETLTRSLPYPPEEAGGLVLREEDHPPKFPDGFPASLTEPVTRALRLRPEDRFATVEEFLTAIGQTSRPPDSLGPVAVPVARATSDEPKTPTSSSVVRDVARGTAGMVKGIVEGFKPGSGSDDDYDDADGSSQASGAGPEPRAGDGAVTPPFVPPSPLPPPAAGSFAVAHTVPVPPPVEGGPIGTLLSSLVLSLEVLVTLLGGGAAWILRGFGMLSGRRRSPQGSPAVAGAAGTGAVVPEKRRRLGWFFVFLLFLFVVGAVVIILFLNLFLGIRQVS